jgi:hypothetical protein
VDPQRQDPERVAALPGEARFDVLTGPDDLAVEGVDDLGIGGGRDAHDVGPAGDRDVAGRRLVRIRDPARVRPLQELGSLVLDRGVEPETGRLDREVPAVLADAALAHVENLLTLEQRLHDGVPFLEGRCAHSGGHPAQDNGERVGIT